MTPCQLYEYHSNHGVITNQVSPGIYIRMPHCWDKQANPVQVQRLAWALHHGADPGTMCIVSMCNDERCLNPEHLQAMTRSQYSNSWGGRKRNTTNKSWFGNRRKD